MSGTVITFYSYKGGVGRSFALANIAVLLGRWGFRVLCIDWDLEAPGLEHFFDSTPEDGQTGSISSSKAPGLVELVEGFQASEDNTIQWRDHAIRLSNQRTPNVSLIKSGRVDYTYSSRLHCLNWNELYGEGLGNAFETMFDELRQEYDYILIDARTGVTDFSGIITAQLPDILAFMFTSNEQSFRGATDVARRAVDARNELSIDRSRLLLLPIPARFESQFEHQISTRWQERFARDLKEYYQPWTPQDSDHSRIVQATTIPYVPIWSFGERLSVVEDSSTDSLSINYSLETLAALIAHRLGQTHFLLDSRDEFVSSARRIAQTKDESRYAVFLSHAHEDVNEAARLAGCLEELGLRTFFQQEHIGDQRIDEALRNNIDRSAHMVVILGKSAARRRWQQYEVRTFLRQAAADEGTRLLIPLILHKMDVGDIPDFLRQYNAIQFQGDFEATAKEVLRVVQPTNRAGEQEGSRLEIRTTSDGDIAIAQVALCALARNGTTVDGSSDQNGTASLRLRKGHEYVLLAAHPRHPAKLLESVSGGTKVDVRLPMGRHSGSLIIHSTGHIPGLNGRLNPILDTSNRTYLYADNISMNGEHKQPYSFAPNVPFELEDASGAKFEVEVKLIYGRTSLLEYRQLAMPN